MLPGILSSIFLVIIIVGHVGSTAFELGFDKNGNLNGEELANKKRLEEANQVAKTFIKAMQKFLDKYDTTNPEWEMYELAFGEKADLSFVRKTIEVLETGTFWVQLKTHIFPDDLKHLVAAVTYEWDSQAQEYVSGTTKFSNDFHHNRLSIADRALFMIHEATHPLANTGDRVSLDGKRILPGNKFMELSNGQWGYVIYNTFSEIRGRVVNMHFNADSYSYFGTLCTPSILDGTYFAHRLPL